MIAPHGAGGSKESERGWLTDLAKRGILGVAIDARYHGERLRRQGFSGLRRGRHAGLGNQAG